MTERLPPHDLDAESAVLSACFIDPAVLDQLRDEVHVGDFYSDANRRIFEAILAVDSADEPVDVVTVANELRARDRLEQAGGTPYIAQLIDSTPSVRNVGTHAAIVRDCARLRRVIGGMQKLVAVGYQPDTKRDIESFLANCEATTIDLGGGGDSNTASMLREAVELELKRIGEAARAGETLPGRSTGMPTIDDMTKGLDSGDFWVVAGRPGMGKTALVTQILLNVALTGGATVFFSLEMKRPQIIRRALSVWSGVAVTKIRTGALTDSEWSKVTEAAQRLASVPMVVDEVEDLTPARLRSKARRHFAWLRREYGNGLQLAVVAVDYLQLMGADERGNSRNEELEDISRKCKKLARKLDTTIIGLSQLNRGRQDQKDKRPTLAELRGSGAFEQDADAVMFVHREDNYRTNRSQHDGMAELILAKARSAGVGARTIRFEDWRTTFVDDRYQDDLPYEPAASPL